MAKPNKPNLNPKAKSFALNIELILLFLWMSVFAVCVAAGMYNGIVFTELMLLHLAGAVLAVMVTPLALVALVWAGYSLIKDAFFAPAAITLVSLGGDLVSDDLSLFEKNFNQFIYRENASTMLRSQESGFGYDIHHVIYLLYKKDTKNFEKYLLELINLIEPGEDFQGLIDELFDRQYLRVYDAKCINKPYCFDESTMMEALLKKNVSTKNKSEILERYVITRNFNMIMLLRKYGATYSKNLSVERRALLEAREQQVCCEQITPERPKPILQKKSKKTVKSVVSTSAGEPVLEKIKRPKKAKA